MTTSPLLLIFLVAFSAQTAHSLDPSDEASTVTSEHDGHLVLNVEHSLDHGDTFEPRGTLTLHSLRSGSSTFAQDTPKQEVTDKLRSLCNDGGLYLLRFSSSNGQVHRAVADACGMVQSGLKDVFTVHLDWKSQLVGVSVSSVLPTLTSRISNSSKRGTKLVLDDDDDDFGVGDSGFDSTVVVQAMESGPQPDTAAFIQRQEQEKLAKQRGETKDNRSFFAKYWMYIVPVVLVMFLSGANPEAQGGGGGGR